MPYPEPALCAFQIQHGPNSGQCAGTGPFLFTFAQKRCGKVVERPCEAKYSGVISIILGCCLVGFTGPARLFHSS